MTYNDFINSILSTRGRFSITDGYKERHHILPRCKGGTNDLLNLIDFAALEHVTAHRLLAQENSTDFQLVNAYNIMTSTHTVSDEEAALSRELFAGVMSIKMKNNNPMFDKNTKDKHAARCASSEFRSNVSAGMKRYRNIYSFSKEHLLKIRNSLNKRCDYMHSIGLNMYGYPIRNQCEVGKTRFCASRCVGVYCIIDNKKLFFESLREAAIWWFNNYKPFGDKYVECTLVRKIKSSILNNNIDYKGECINNIKWFYTKEGDNVEIKTSDTSKS